MHNHIDININNQTLIFYAGHQVEKTYSVSTAINGSGELDGSGCTPRGHHKIRIKIGQGCSVNTVFKGRRPTGEVYSSELGFLYPDRDWILTRILWLTGDELHFNRGGKVDTLRRFIYLHGCPDECQMGIPLSHGCIRMKNKDIIDLFDRVENQMPVFIHD